MYYKRDKHYSYDWFGDLHVLSLSMLAKRSLFNSSCSKAAVQCLYSYTARALSIPQSLYFDPILFHVALQPRNKHHVEASFHGEQKKGDNYFRYNADCISWGARDQPQ